MNNLLIIFLVLFLLAVFFISFISISIYIHNNMRGTKLWNFINNHIIADEDEYLKNK